MELFHDDCIKKLRELPDASVDMVCVDLPYGTTECSWDTVIDLPKMWKQLKRVVKDKGMMCFFSAQPFTSTLVGSQPALFKEELIWKKNKPTNFFNCNKMHLKEHENIIVFCNGRGGTYNPQKTQGLPYKVKRQRVQTPSDVYASKTTLKDIDNPGIRFPTSIVVRDVVAPINVCHPTEKPEELLKYLIKTYSNEGETVLDFTMGSGSTGVAAKKLGRKFIGIEKDPTWFEVAKKRMGMTQDEWIKYVRKERPERLKKRKRTSVG